MTIENQFGARSLLRFLLGDRQAILAAAGTRGLLWLGLSFVLSAGLAREYDAEDLLHEPWYALLPIPASLVTSALLYWYVDRTARRCGLVAPPVNYPQFLALYWLTAPLAWLYAVPVERFMTARDSVTANLAFLGIVSLWRVLLFGRVVSVLYGVVYWIALATVLMLVDALAIFVTCCTPVPAVGVMGGIGVPESQQPVAFVMAMVCLVAVIAWPALLIAIYFIVNHGPRWTPARIHERRTVSRSLWALAGAAIVIGMGVLPWTQPEQVLRRDVEKHVARDDWKGAVAIMSAHELADFPPHWQPPPERLGRLKRETDRLSQILSASPAPWVRSHYLNRFGRVLLYDLPSTEISGEEIQPLLDLLEQSPASAEILATHRPRLLAQLRHFKRGSNEERRLRAVLGVPEGVEP